MDTHRKDLYPDVTASGGLVSAMKEALKLRGSEVWPAPSTADAIVIETARGLVSVVPATEERRFRVRVHIPGFTWDVPGFTWEIGSTDRLESLVRMVAAWREGVAFDELAARFTFLELDEFARALKRGEPTSSQWADLLSTEFHRKQWGLLRRLHEDEALRHMFPTISHGAVRLRVDLLDGASRQVLVHEQGERYEVRVGVPGAAWVEVPTGELIAHLRAALNEQ
ncbi:hypothetical protein E3E14_00875 [Streptomyces sp. ICN441]|uniref:hypothetical protein n=1 Tax=Streptomyces sp. ICN441 TaxID=2558286 RepID=UPI00106C07FA|nr:hypothetical protein [Streptomyces sp. ICN441]TFE58436.1 hypothetical protein E3E14_00875 [Streptomyces sp. ICN441]